MMKEGAGIVIGRFQVHDLHKGHHHIINTAARHQKLMVVVGLHRTLAIPTNPLDFPTRELMIKSYYPNAMVAGLNDEPSDKYWSTNLDNLIRTYFPTDPITLYCGRDGFKSHYHGKFKVVEVDEVHGDTGTQSRKEIGRVPVGSVDFRKGVIYSTFNQYSRVYPAVDVIPVMVDVDYRNVDSKVLLIQKKCNPNKYGFAGGFTDLSDKTGEDAAKRELYEETGLTAEGSMVYVGSYRVQDWRQTEYSGIHTTLFFTVNPRGPARAGDDADYVEWVPIDQLLNREFFGSHKMLAEEFLKKWNKENKKWHI